MTGKVCHHPMLTYFVSFWLNGWNTDLGLETERHHIASFDVGGDESLASKSSFWESKLFRDSQIDADFWPGQRLIKSHFEGRHLCVPFKMARLHLGSWVNRLSAKFTCDDLCESYWERVMWWYFARIKCGNIVWLVVDSFTSARNVVNCMISWSCWQTDFRYVVALLS